MLDTWPLPLGVIDVFFFFLLTTTAGFQHAAFALWNESYLSKSSLVTSGTVPPGGLISLLQKGLLYVDVEWHVTEVCVCLHSACFYQ